MTAPATPTTSKTVSIWLRPFLALVLTLTAARAGTEIGPLTTGPMWSPVNMGELAEKTPLVEPEADAEFLLRDVTIDQSSGDGSINTYYERVKIYTQRGVE